MTNTQTRVLRIKVKIPIPNEAGCPWPPSDHAPRPAGGLPPTGDDRVDAAVGGLGRLAGRPVDEHVAVLEEVHGRLRDILGELNEASP